MVSLDDVAWLDLARGDPIGFLAQLNPSAAIDEFQRGGDALLLALKMALDNNNTRGQYLLAGSTRFLTMRSLTETLTGRIGLLDLSGDAARTDVVTISIELDRCICPDSHRADQCRASRRGNCSLLESFVVGEVAKQISWAERPTTLHHYRDRDQREVDIVLERGQSIAGIEVKATSTPTMAHAKHLVYLRERLGDRFSSGVVLHTGTHRLQLGDRISAVPVSTLWGT